MLQGDGTIRFFEVTDTKPYVFGLSLVTYTLPARGVCVMPQHNLNYLKCEVMRFYRLQQTKSVVEPVNMIVPRKVCLCVRVQGSIKQWGGGGGVASHVCVRELPPSFPLLPKNLFSFLVSICLALAILDKPVEYACVSSLIDLCCPLCVPPPTPPHTLHHTV